MRLVVGFLVLSVLLPSCARKFSVHVDSWIHSRIDVISRLEELTVEFEENFESPNLRNADDIPNGIAIAKVSQTKTGRTIFIKRYQGNYKMKILVTSALSDGSEISEGIIENGVRSFHVIEYKKAFQRNGIDYVITIVDEH